MYGKSVGKKHKVNLTGDCQINKEEKGHVMHKMKIEIEMFQLMLLISRINF